MRLNGEISDWEEEEEEENRESENNMQAFPQQQKLVVGYALTLKKKKSFLQPNFERLARYLLEYLFLFPVYICIDVCFWNTHFMFGL
ncbi:hypothetical protein SLA2020_444660 [Shorea laevis]